MEGLVILLVLICLWVLIAPIIALVNASGADRKAEAARQHARELEEKLATLDQQLRKLRNESIHREHDEIEKPPVIQEPRERFVLPEARRAMAMPPPLKVMPKPEPVRAPVADWDSPVMVPPVIPDAEPEEEKEPFSLERFMGVKLFAWLGGVAMFFGVIFFVKYAFENNLIPPAVRVALGFLSGTALLVGGLLTHRVPKYKVLGQVFCATGVVILYGVSFAAHAIYRFPAFGTVPTMVLMSLITLAAFLIAVRLNALVVAVLGMLGGFLTPVLVSTGRDEVLGLFGYIALLDIGLLAVSLHRRWRFLVAAAALGTVVMQMGWCKEFFMVGRYFEGNRILIPMGILVFFVGLFKGGCWWGRKRVEKIAYAEGSVLGLAAVAMVFAFTMLSFHQVAERYVLLYGFVMMLQLAVVAVAVMRPQLAKAQIIAALVVFLHLAAWSTWYLTTANLGGALALYLVFGALHAVVPVVLAMRMPTLSVGLTLQAGPWFAPLTVLMMLLPLFHLSPVPMLIWPAILTVDLLVIILAAATGRVLPVLASLALTLGVAAMWILKIPVKTGSLMQILGVISGFSLVFAVAGRWLARGMPTEADKENPEMNVASMLPVCSAMLPFGLLVLALLQLPVANPSPVFGVALLMTVLLSGLAVIGRQGPLVLAALVCTLAVEAVWHIHHFKVDSPMTALWWYLGFYALFMAFPFVFRKACADQAVPWIASALSGVGHFLLVHDLVKRAFPNSMMGLVPAAFAVPALIALVAVVRQVSAMDSLNRSRMAWFGGVALFFITLIFPIQFDRQWITVSWALEGALLLWLFRRVPHPGLQLTGLALLAVCFVRLALNPAVFTDYARSGTAIFNWHLYAYGIVAAAQFAGAGWFTDPDGRWNGYSPRGVLQAFGGVLLFLLLNIEIADYFTKPGDRSVAFVFGGNFARDMTYSIAWGLFSLIVLGIGFWKQSKYARFAATGLLVVTVLKVLAHDMAASQTIFRIGALLGVAVITFVAAFLYQRFFDRIKQS